MMEGVPAGMGDWGVRGVLLESERLLNKHLRDFLPIILMFIFPAALIRVLHTQFFKADYVGSPIVQGSYFPDPTSFSLLLLPSLLWSLLLIIALFTMAQVLRDTIYTTDLKADLHSQSLFTRVKLAFTFREVGPTGGSFERFREASTGKKLKGISAAIFCLLIPGFILGDGRNYTPEAVAAMGLPPWTIFLFTLFFVSSLTFITSYFLLVILVVALWMLYPETGEIRTLTMEGVSAGMGDSGIKRNFHEGGRILSTHLRDFLPIILVFIFPAALITVLHIQFLKPDRVGPPGSYIPDPRSSWLLWLLNLLWTFALPQVLIFLTLITMPQVVRDAVYTTDLKAERHSQSLYTRVKLAFTFREVDPTGRSFERFKEASTGKMLKDISATTACVLLPTVIPLSGLNFTPEAVAAMGLPPWTIFLFTLLIVTITTLAATYFPLVGMVCVFDRGLQRRSP